MCEICDGKTYEELWAEIDSKIGANGWTLQAVAPSPPEPGWVYTIGLVEGFGHPELVVTDPDPVAYGSLLDEISEHVRRGERFGAGGALDLDGYRVEFGPVHPSYLANGLLASWESYYRWTGDPPATLDALQVVLPLTEWCDTCDLERRCLARPGALTVGGGANRMARRAAMRRRDRRR